MNQDPPDNSGTQTTIKTFSAAILIIIAAVFSLFLWWWFTPPKGVVEADAGFKRAKQTINPEELRQWAFNQMNRRPATNSWQYIPDAEIPPYIRNLYSYPPEDAAVTEESVVISWGGGFFHWFIEVGSTNFSKSFHSGNSEYPYNFEWVRGIYYSREARWKLQ